MFLYIWTISDDFTTTPTAAERKHIPMELMRDMVPMRDSKIVVAALVAVTTARTAEQKAQPSTAQVLAGSY